VLGDRAQVDWRIETPASRFPFNSPPALVLLSQSGLLSAACAGCVSRDGAVCHRIPSPKALLKEGAIVNLDVTTEAVGTVFTIEPMINLTTILHTA